MRPFSRQLFGTAAATAAAAVAGSVATSRGISSAWYRSLRLPSIQPPPVAFPVAWTALYADIAVTTARALADRDPATRRPLRRVLAANLVLNTGWCWTFFAAHRIRLGTVVAAALTISSTDLARRVGRDRRGLGLALTPYALWCAFATVLTATIGRQNM